MSEELQTALEVLRSKPAGHAVNLSLRSARGVDLPAWCEEHGLIYYVNGRNLRLQSRKQTPYGDFKG